MLPVLPKLISELQLDKEAKRVAALQLLGRLLSSPGSDMDTSYPELFTEFLRRACDEKVIDRAWIGLVWRQIKLFTDFLRRACDERAGNADFDLPLS